MLPITVHSSEQGDECPIRQVLSKVTGKWQILIIFALEDGALRFGEVKRTIGDVTQRVLTQNLRSMERDGYLTRTVHPGPPVAVSYELTEVGHSLVERLKPLAIWAAEVHPTVLDARTAFDERI